MRPQVDHLIHQLKNHRALVDHPDAAVEVIHAVAHKFFVFEKLRPEEAFQAMQHLHAIWNLSLGSVGEKSDRQLESVQNYHTEDEPMKSQSLPETQPNVGSTVDLSDRTLMRRVRQIIWDHTYETIPEGGSPECSCGEFFDLGEEWASHVRKLIWRELRG